MKRIVIASHNPIKVQATLRGFEAMFPGEEFITESVSASSGVPDQPMNDRETYEGAYNRAVNAVNLQPQANFWVGLEGGIEAKQTGMEVFGWVVVLTADGHIGRGKTGVFFLPLKVAELIVQGKELGEADDIVFGKRNSKQSGGAIGLLTDNVVSRMENFSRAVIFALIPFKNPTLY